MEFKQLLLVFVFILLSVSSWAAFSERQDWVKSMIFNTEQCITDCKTVYTICNPNLVFNVNLENTVSVSFKDNAKNVRAYPYEFLVERTESVSVPQYRDIITRNDHIRGRFANGTEDVVRSATVRREIAGYKQELKTSYHPIRNFVLADGECVNLTVKSARKLEAGRKIDNILSINTGFQTFTYPEWSWWNNGWAYAQNITSSKVLTLTNPLSWLPVCINNCSFNHSGLVSLSKSAADGKDLRIINESGNYEWPYQFEGELNTVNTTIWFLSNFSAGSVNNTDAVYYGNITNAISTTNPRAMWDVLGVKARFDFANATGQALTSSNQDVTCAVQGTGNPLVVSHPKYGIRFDPATGGNDDFFNCGDNDNFFTNVQGTYILVFKAYGLGSPPAPLSLLSKENTGNNDGVKLGVNFGFGAFSNDKITLAWSQESAANLAIDNDTMATNQLYTVMAVYDNIAGGTTNISLFVNGVLKNSTTANDMGGTNDNPFTIGGGCNGAGCGSPVREFDGEISEVMIFDRVVDIDWYKQYDYCVRFGCSLTSAGEYSPVSAVPLPNPNVSILGILPSTAYGNTSLQGQGISGFANFTEYYGGNGTVYFTWAKNGERNYSMISAVPATSAYSNVSTIVNYTLKLNRNDVLTLSVNATNGTDYSPEVNTSITISISPPTIPPIRSPANGSVFYNAYNVTLTCNGSVMVDTNVPASPQYAFYASETVSIPVDQTLNATLEPNFHFENLNSSKYYWTCRAFDGASVYSDFAHNLTFTVNNTLLLNKSVVNDKNVLALTTNSVVWDYVFNNYTALGANLTFMFNGVTYGTTTKTYLANDTVRFTGAYVAPSIAGFNTTIQLEWNLSLTWINGTTNTTYYNTSINVLNSVFGLCNATNPFATLNISVKFETNYTSTDTTTQAATFIVYPESITSNTTYGFNRTAISGISEYDYCLSTNGKSVFTNSIFITSKDGYASREYWLEAYNLTGGSLSELSVYLLDNSKASYVSLKVQDEYGRGISGALVAVEKWDVSSVPPDDFKRLHVAKTDSNGQAVLPLQLDEPLYRFVVTINGLTRLITIPAKLSDTTLTLTINPETVFEHDKFTGVDWSLAFDNDTRVYSLTWNNPNNKAVNMCLKVGRLSFGSGSNLTLSDACLSAVTGTLTYTVPNQDGTYTALAYGKGSLFSFGGRSDVIDRIVKGLDFNDGQLLAFVLAGTLAITGVAISGAAGGILFLIGGLIVTTALSLSAVPLLVLMGVAIVGGLLIWKIR